MTTAERELARQQMIQDYKDSHPGVDWDTHELLFIRTRGGGWGIDSHRPRDPQLDAIVARICCGGTCQFHSTPQGSADPENETDPIPQAS